MHFSTAVQQAHDRPDYGLVITKLRCLDVLFTLEDHQKKFEKEFEKQQKRKRQEEYSDLEYQVL